MSDPIIIPGAYRVAMQYKEGALDRVNVFHVGWDGPDGASLNAVADAFDSHDNTYGKGLRTPGTTLNTITVTDISAGLQPQYTKPIIPPRPGTASGGALPGNVTSTVSWRGAYIGRKNRGRTYMVDTPTLDVTAGETITGTRQAGLATWANALLNLVLPAPMWLGVGSPVRGTITKMISFVVEAVIDSQRNRLPGRGR